ncbi:MAG: hypothetical protein PHQ00_00915 [Phycisphaerae bacterium]|nr:hypothetical protein [Phycisphaerae bacterium]
MEKKKIKLKTRVLISVVFGVFALIIGFCISWAERSGDTPEKIRETEQTIEGLYKEADKETQDIFDRISFWENIEKITNSLLYQNEKIAKAKALIHCKESPIPSGSFDEYLWDNRYEVSSHKWMIQTFGSRILVGIGIAILSCLGTTISIFLILAIAPWLWYFLLGRLSELSQAIQGK